MKRFLKGTDYEKENDVNSLMEKIPILNEIQTMNEIVTVLGDYYRYSSSGVSESTITTH